MVSEDFSFPKITNPLPHFAISPSLWRVSSVVYPDFCDQDDHEIAKKSSRIFLKNEEDAVVKGESSSINHDQEEKMDMLWEDFNEELQRVSSLGKKKPSISSKNKSFDWSAGEQVEMRLCCAEALQMSKRGTNIFQANKKQSLVSVVKSLKKIFFLHRSTRIKKRQYNP